MIQPEHIAPCGMNCALCLAYQRPKNKCLGCRDETPKSAKSCESCIIKNCETIRNSPSHFCYECPDIPCNRLKKLDIRYRKKYAMSMIDNLNEIKKDGIDSFLASQTTKYTCPTCNGLICIHRGRCLICNPWKKGMRSYLTIITGPLRFFPSIIALTRTIGIT